MHGSELNYKIQWNLNEEEVTDYICKIKYLTTNIHLCCCYLGSYLPEIATACHLQPSTFISGYSTNDLGNAVEAEDKMDFSNIQEFQYISKGCRRSVFSCSYFCYHVCE